MTIATYDKNFALISKKRKRGLFYTFFLILFLGVVMAAIYAISVQEITRSREVKEYSDLTEMQNNITAKLNVAGVDLSYFSHSKLAIDTLSLKDDTAKKYLTSLMHDISTLHRRYAQIRLLDKQGNEVIRIDQRPDLSLQQIPENQLQNKKHRYYFENALQLNAGDIYASQFDLNVEDGKVEYPIKPMIRFATPIYSKKDKPIGVGVVNYNGKEIIQTMMNFNAHRGDQVYLINDDGYYLKANDPNKEWGFMLPERKQFRFSEEHPDVWAMMLKNEKNSKTTTKDGEYYFTSFHLSPALSFNSANIETVHLVLHVPKKVIKKELEMLIKGMILGFILIAPMLSFLAYKLAYSQVEQDWLFKKLNFDANHDSLTGLYNRQAIVTYLDKSISLSHRKNLPLSVCFMDINDLKKINDIYGHEEGDNLIKGLAIAINNSIRNSDFAARLGGDEFLIVFVDCDIQSANLTMQRIQDYYGALGRRVDKKWSMSFGCAELQDNSDDVDKLIERADNAMYKHKKKMKSKKL